MDNYILTILVVIVSFGYVFELFLEYLNSTRYSKELPTELEGIYDEKKYVKSQEYEKETTRFGLLTGTFSFLLMLAMLLFGGFALVDEWARNITEHYILLPLLFFGVLTVASDIITEPFSLYRTFVIEEKYGFNKTTPKTYILDKIKGAILGAIIGGAILSLIIWFYYQTGPFFWVWAWVLVSAFMLFMTMFYASLIVPIFNKLTPLEEGDLRKAIENYCEQVEFKLDDLYVMDGSKRSTKANAFFSGLGKKKSIVLYDTLIENHTHGEIVAVLAHEIGHYKKKHTQTSVILSIAQTGLTLYIISLLLGNPALSEALGASKPGFHLELLVFGILYSPISMILGLGMNIISRKNEYEADAYAKETYNGNALREALKKLSVNNLSNPRPHPTYVFFHYSHPPLLKRLEALKA